MCIRIVIFLFSLSLFACKKENSPLPEFTQDDYEIIDPDLIEIKVLGNIVEIEWEHLVNDHVSSYELWIEKKLYKNPPKFFTEELRYDKAYSGKILANYPEGVQAVTDFQFHTEKSKVLITACRENVLAINLYNKTILWEYNWPSRVGAHGSPYIYNDQVIIGNTSVISLDILTGEKNWETIPDDPNGFKTQFLSVADGAKLFLTSMYSQTNYLYSFDLNTGAMTFKSDYSAGGSLAIGTYIYMTGGGIYAYDKSGVFQWSAALERGSGGVANYVTAQPVVSEGDLFFSDKLGRIYSIDAQSGKRNWYITSPYFDECISPPTIFQSNLIISGINNLFSINANDGQINWMFVNQKFQGSLESAPFIYDNKIYFGTSWGLNGSIVALDGNDGQVIWEKILGSRVDNGLIVFEDFIYAGTNDEIVQLDRYSGEVVWSLERILANLSAPVAVVGMGEKIVYSTASGNIH